MKKLRKLLKVSIFKTIYFNFHYFPIKQAVKFPVFLFNTELRCMKGNVYIDLPPNRIKPGMIQIGYRGTPIYADEPSVWRNRGNVHFCGKCYLGVGSAICCYPKANLVFGNDFVATIRFKIECFKNITFGDENRIGWECIAMDSSQHRIKDEQKNILGDDASPICTGKNFWLGTRSILLKGAILPDYCIVGAGSVVNKDFSNYGSNILLANEGHLVVKKRGVAIYPDEANDSIARDFWNQNGDG